MNLPSNNGSLGWVGESCGDYNIEKTLFKNIDIDIRSAHRPYGSNTVGKTPDGFDCGGNNV